MSLNVDDLSDYVDENRDPLLSAAIAGARTAQRFTIQTGFKNSGAVNNLETDVVFQVDTGGRTPSGVTKLSQRILTVGAIKVEEDLDVKDLNKTYQMHNMKAGSKDDVLPFEQEYTELKSKKISEALEVAIWQGDTDSVVVNLNKFDGFLKIIDADGNVNVIDGNPSDASTIDKDNILGIIDDIYELIPTALLTKDDVEICMGFDVFRIYTQALKDANLFHYNANAEDFVILIPATKVKAVALEGLDGTSRIITVRTSMSIIGTDLEHEEEEYDLWYSKDDKVMKFDAAFKYGTQVAFLKEIVEFTLDPGVEQG